ncbi:hypothetical protein Pfo_005897 [Paulownia fortunei]|nr:hypothetical protein Pfo_005897 [Paulownia fortunei]
MDPVCKNMQSYPYQKDQIHYCPHYYPGTEAVPTQMYVNPARPPISYGCWPWGSNYGYASPTVCHGCCNHTCIPTHYAWGSPYSHVPPRHCPGSYPSFPVQYVPPPCYAMGQPWYEYEKNVPMDHHCCGCPNHLSYQREQKNVGIEEEQPDRERRKNDSLVPFQFKNSPYPIVWLPPDYSNSKEQGNANNSGDSKDGSLDVKANGNGKTIEQQPAFWNGWYPLDLNNLVSSKQRGDVERNHKQDDGKGRFPFPLLWIPYKPEEKEREKHKVDDANTKPGLESEKGSGGEQKFYVNGENIGGQAASRSKDIPLKAVEKHEEKESSKNQEKERDASMKDGIDSGEKKLDNGEKKFPKDGAKRKSPSPPKSSKLPPVCLRVDPLPRRKTANGSSRSPSPPGDKQKPDLWSNEASNILNSSDNKKLDKILHNEFKEGKGTKTIEVVDGKTWQGNNIDVNMETPVNFPVKSKDDFLTNQTVEKPKEENISHECAETDAVMKGQSEDAGSAIGKKEELFRAEEVRADEAKESSKTKLSEEEAAVIIQSAYRGYDIRRWEPIKKLKQIAKVQEQIANVKHLIQAMESSSDIQGSSKQRNIIAETIMSLLLKLDTIQGLHPSIREARKSVVRELVSLQEKLDSLMNEKSGNSPEQESIMRCDEDALNKTEDVVLSQNGNETPSDLLEAHQNQVDGGSNYENSEISEANLNGEEAREKLEKEAAENEDEKSIKNEDEKSNEVPENDETSTAKEDHEDLARGQSSQLSILENSSVTVTDFAPTDCDKLGNELAENLQGEFGDIYAQESTNHGTVDADTSKARQGKQLEEGLIEAPFTSVLHNDAADKENKEHLEIHEVLDLPLSGVNVNSQAEETSPIDGPLKNCKLDDKFGTEEAVDLKTGDARFEPEECAVQQPQNIIADMFEPSEASVERELPTTEACNGKYATCNKLHEDSEVSHANNPSMLEEAPDTPPEKEMSSQLLQEGNLEQEINLINEPANTYEAADMVGVKEAAEDKSEFDRIDSGNCPAPQIQSKNDYGEVFEEREPQMMEACQGENEGLVDAPPEMEALSEQDQECSMEHPLPKENLEAQGFEDASGNEENAVRDGMDIMYDGAKDRSISQVDHTLSQVSLARDDLTESNRKLIEENERLREIMEKLIKSGQEQLTAISSLSGRVKDLERRLSKKKKLKMKQYRAPRSGSLCKATSDGSAEQRTLEVAM